MRSAYPGRFGMTDAQFKVLEMLEKVPRETSRTTHHGFVAGGVVRALCRQGLARRVPGGNRIEITPKGILTLIDERDQRERIERILSRWDTQSPTRANGRPRQKR